MEEVEKYNKIGGWLLFLVFGWCFSLFKQFTSIFDIMEMFKNGTFDILRDVNSEFYNPNVVPLIQYEFIGGILCIIGIFYGLMLMFKKSIKFPKYAIIFLILVQAASVIDIVWGYAIGIEITSELVGQVIGGIIAAIVWISYLKKSVRVEQTFIN